MSDPHEFIREWNRAAIQRNGGVVISPRGQISAETAADIQLAEEAGRPVSYVTLRYVRHIRAAQDTARPTTHRPANGQDAA